jgi:hypothetical protein
VFRIQSCFARLTRNNKITHEQSGVCVQIHRKTYRCANYRHTETSVCTTLYLNYSQHTTFVFKPLNSSMLNTTLCASTLKVQLFRFCTRLLSSSPKGYMEVTMGYSQQDCRSIGSSLLLDSVLLLCGMMLSMVRGSSFSTMGLLFYILQLF